MKRFILLWMFVGVALSHAEYGKAIEDMNLTQHQKESIDNIRNAITHCVDHAEDKIRAVLTPEQRKQLASRERERMEWILVK